LGQQFVYTMQDLGKVVPPDRVVLEDITLAFLPGAKIGVLGANGAGKSSLLRIMAGVDSDFVGDAKPAPGIRVGYLPQEPELDPTKDVLGNVEEGVAELRALLRRFEAVSEKFAEPLDDDAMAALLEEQGKLQDQTCADCCCRSPTCCCSTSPRITSTRNPWPGSSVFSRNTRGRSWPSPMIAISWTTPRGGSWS
jgi:ATPase subunit of ABC transporter with duplicated ATPase domains